MKLDLKDKKILYELDLNSRATLNEIAKKVGLSKQVVDYHLKNLIKNNVIQQFYTVINFSKLGYTQYKLYLKFQNVNPATEKEILITQISPVFTKAYLTEKKEKKRFTYGREIEHYELDDIDIKILKIFSTNARMAILEMIEKLNLTATK